MPLTSKRTANESQISANYQLKEHSVNSKKKIPKNYKIPLNLDLPSAISKGGNQISFSKSALKSARKASILTIEADLPPHDIIVN